MADIYKKKSRWKWHLAIAGLIVVGISMIYTRYLINRLAEEEVKKVGQLKMAYETLSKNDPDATQCDFTFQDNFFKSNTTVPILLVGEDGVPQMGKNYGEANDTNKVFLTHKLQEFRSARQEPFVMQGEGVTLYLYFEHSRILKLLTYYPFLQMILVAAFIAFGYFGFSSARRAEQNRVWVGMAKETAHQLGTPISGIVAWIEHLKSMDSQNEEMNEVVSELRNDVQRLELIADRFSKIGSAPELTDVNIYEVLDKCRLYMQKRASRKVQFKFPGIEREPLKVKLNPPLFEWVVENLLRNALDAMEGGGEITAEVIREGKTLNIDITDTGKGIPSSKFKSVFMPGYTTKKRGWGLGLSLAKRIVEEYHSGKIFVKKSIINVGTTFTIQLPL
jgi:signal transduction histidine kinase